MRRITLAQRNRSFRTKSELWKCSTTEQIKKFIEKRWTKSKAKYTEDGEKSSKYFLNLEK